MAARVRERYQRLSNSLDDSRGRRALRLCKQNALLISTVIFVVAAVFVGVIVALYSSPSREAILWVSLPGEVFLSILQFLVVPLIVLSIVTGIGNMSLASSGSLGWRVLLYYSSTTVFASVLGVALAMIIQPGLRFELGAEEGSCVAAGVGPARCNLTVADTVADLIRNLFPDNLFAATIYQRRTTCEPCVRSTPSNDSIATPTNNSMATPTNGSVTTPTVYHYSVEYGPGPNMLGLIVFSITFGIVLSRLGEDGRRVLRFLDILNMAVMKMVDIAMWYSPIGVFFLILAKMMPLSNVESTFAQLGLYIVTVMCGLVIHGCIVLPLLYLVVARRNPLKLAYGVLQALTTAFATASSAVTLPVTLQCLERKMGMDRRVSRFMVPVGATVNMDGTALYEAVAVLFIAQLRIPSQLDFGKILLIAITATLAAVGAAAVPSAGLFTMVIVLNSVGLDTRDIALLLVVDWLLDRFRTAVNVFGDCVGCGIVDRYAPRFLPLVGEQAPTPSGNGARGEEGEESSLIKEEDETIPLEYSGSDSRRARGQPEQLGDGEAHSTLM